MFMSLIIQDGRITYKKVIRYYGYVFEVNESIATISYNVDSPKIKMAAKMATHYFHLFPIIDRPVIMVSILMFLGQRIHCNNSKYYRLSHIPLNQDGHQDGCKDGHHNRIGHISTNITDRKAILVSITMIMRSNNSLQQQKIM